jgi:hypothetical protein
MLEYVRGLYSETVMTVINAAEIDAACLMTSASSGTPHESDYHIS